MKLDIIPEKKRKLTFSIFGLVALLVGLFTGAITGPEFTDAFKLLVGAFIAGNVGEHLSDSGSGVLGAVIGSFSGKKKRKS